MAGATAAQGLMAAVGMNPYGQGSAASPYSSYPVYSPYSQMGLTGGDGSPNDASGWGSGFASGAASNPILGSLPGDPQNQAAIGQISSLGSAALGGSTPGYTPRSPYGPNTYDSNQQFQMYDPSGGMGYGGAVGQQQSGLSFGQQDPSQLAAIASMYGSDRNANAQLGAAQFGMQGNIGAAQAGAQGQIGAAHQTALGSENVAQTQAGSANYLGDLGLKGLQGTNATNLAMNQGNNATQLGLGGLNLQGIQGTNLANQNIAQTQAGAQMGVAGLGLQGTENTNLTNQNIAGINSQTQLGLGGMNLQGIQGTNAAQTQQAQIGANAQTGVAGINAGAQENVANTQAMANLGIANTQAGAQMYNALTNAIGAQNVAAIQTLPQEQKISLLKDLLGPQFGGGSTGGVGQTALPSLASGGTSGLSSLGLTGGSSGGGAPTAGSALGNAALIQGLGGGTAGAGGTGGLDTSGAGTPAVPQNQPINAQQLQQNLGAGQAKIDQQIATLRNQLLQKRGSAGMNESGGLPAGLEQQLQQQALQSGTQNNLDWQNYANQTNNQNNLAYGQLGLGQYNAQQNRMLQLLGLEAPYQQGTASLGSNLMLGLLG